MPKDRNKGNKSAKIYLVEVNNNQTLSWNYHLTTKVLPPVFLKTIEKGSFTNQISFILPADFTIQMQSRIQFN